MSFIFDTIGIASTSPYGRWRCIATCVLVEKRGLTNFATISKELISLGPSIDPRRSSSSAIFEWADEYAHRCLRGDTMGNEGDTVGLPSGG